MQPRHPLQHDVAPLGRRYRMFKRIEGRGVLDEASEHGRLGQRQRPRRRREVELRGDLHAVGLVVEVGGVQVRGEQLMPCHAAHDVGGDAEFGQLPRDRDVAAPRRLLRVLRRQDAGVLDVLLGDV